MISALQAADIGALYWIQENMRVGFLDKPMVFLSWLGNIGLIWLLFIAVMIVIPRYRKTGLTALLAIFFSLLICNLMLKPLVARVRPYDVYSYITVLVELPTDLSFPSGHASASFAVAVVMFRFIDKRYSWLYLTLAALISFSRLYVGVHYPSDVLGGIVMGIICALFALWLAPKIEAFSAKSGA